jgi:DNA-binding NtrC family response regulator
MTAVAHDTRSHLALVVEDDPDVRQLAAALIEETTLDVVEVESGEDALRLMRDRGAEVALVFTDVLLPGRVDGVELARDVAALCPQARVLVTSGHPDRGGDLPEGATFIAKPWRALDVLVHAERASAAAEVA